MKFIKDRIRGILQLDDPPSKLATAFALGVFIAFSPTIGLHTISCLFFAWIFRLSKFVVVTAAFVNNPWTVFPLYGFCLWFGMKITGSAAAAPHIAWNEITLSSAYLVLRPFLWPFVAGSVAVGAVAACVAYVVMYWAIVRYRKVGLK